MKKLNLKSLNNEILVNNIAKDQNSEADNNYEKIDVDTCFGETHLLRSGNKKGKPVLIFHEENSTCEYCLNQYKILLKDYNVYTCDITWHFGYLSKHSDGYGKWASDIIDGLGYKKMICIGESFGGQIVVKLMCFSPTKLMKSILISPYGIIKAQRFKVFFNNIIPKILYKITRKDKFLYKSINVFVSYDDIKKGCNDITRRIYNYVKPSSIFSEEINPYDAAMCLAPTLVFAGERDVVFSSSKLLKTAKNSFFNSRVYTIKNCAHIAFLSESICREVNTEIMKFLSIHDDASVIKYKDVVG